MQALKNKKMNKVLLSLVVMLVTIQIQAQNNGSISGKVTDLKGEAIPNVNVVVQGSSYGISSNERGEYILKNLNIGKKEIVFTAIGYSAKLVKLTITNKSTQVVDVLLDEAFSELGEVVVTGDMYGDDYLTNTTTVATKLAVHPKELPVGLDILSQHMLKQMNPVRITEAIQYLSGINQETGFGGRTDVYVIRGFRSDRESIFKNGFRNPMRIYRESSNIQQIEVLKGPSSALFGVSDPGGTINIATKRPKSIKHGEVEFFTNSFGRVRPSIDLGGPLGNEKNLNYRLNAAYEMGGTYRDQINTERVFLAPSIAYNISPKTSISVNGEYLKHDQATDRGVPIYDSKTDTHYNFKSDKSFGDPYNRTINKNSLTQAEIVHKFLSSFSVRSAVNALYTTGERESVEVSGFVALDTVKRYYQNQRHTEDYYAWQNEILGSFTTGNIKHNAVIGVEISKLGTNMFIQRDKNYDIVSVFNTQYNQLPPNELNLITSHDYKYDVYNYGFYLQDFMVLNEYINVIAGLRYDIYNSSYDNHVKDADTESEHRNISPRIGLLVKPTKQISLFSNYSKGFNPIWGNPANKNGDSFDPMINGSFDVGVKMYFMNNRFNITANYFDLKRKGMLVDDPDDQDYSVQTGEARSTGFELDVQGEPIPGWTFISSYSYTDARISEDTNADKIGQDLENVAPHMYKLWMNYELQSTALKGLGIGAGFRYISERAADDGIDVQKLDAYNIVDSRLFYRTDHWTASVAINNVVNTKHILGSQSYTRAMPGAPRNLSLSFNYSF